MFCNSVDHWASFNWVHVVVRCGVESSGIFIIVFINLTYYNIIGTYTLVLETAFVICAMLNHNVMTIMMIRMCGWVTALAFSLLQ